MNCFSWISFFEVKSKSTALSVFKIKMEIPKTKKHVIESKIFYQWNKNDYLSLRNNVESFDYETKRQKFEEQNISYFRADRQREWTLHTLQYIKNTSPPSQNQMIFFFEHKVRISAYESFSNSLIQLRDNLASIESVNQMNKFYIFFQPSFFLSQLKQCNLIGLGAFD